jgi:hypothetical protein
MSQAPVAEDLCLVNADAIGEACKSKYMKGDSSEFEILTAAAFFYGLLDGEVQGEGMSLVNLNPQ